MKQRKFKAFAKERELLARRGLIIEHPRRFINIMQTESCYNIINGYKQPFLATSDPERYTSGTTFEQIYAFYEFDQALSNLFLLEILKIEKTIKSLISKVFSEKYGVDHRNFLSRKHFNNNSFRLKKNSTDIGYDLKQNVQDAKAHGRILIVESLTKNNCVPMDAVTTIMTFEKTANFYKAMKSEDRQRIADKFGISTNKMEMFLTFLASLRNTCAHGGRIYTSDYDENHTRRIPDTAYHQQLGIPQATISKTKFILSGGYIHGKADVTAILIAFKIFLKPTDFAKLKHKFLKLKCKLDRQIPILIMAKIDSMMGQPVKYINSL